MLQINVIRDHKERVLEGLKKRNFKEAEDLIAQVLETDIQRKNTQKKADDLRAQSNENSKKTGELIKGGKTEEVDNLKAQMASDKHRIKVWEEGLAELEMRLQELLYKIPNIPHQNVLAGKGVACPACVLALEYDARHILRQRVAFGRAIAVGVPQDMSVGQHIALVVAQRAGEV